MRGRPALAGTGPPPRGLGPQQRRTGGAARLERPGRRRQALMRDHRRAHLSWQAFGEALEAYEDGGSASSSKTRSRTSAAMQTSSSCQSATTSSGHTVGEQRRSLEARVVSAAEAALADQSYVSPVDVLVGVGWLTPQALDVWRQLLLSPMQAPPRRGETWPPSTGVGPTRASGGMTSATGSTAGPSSGPSSAAKMRRPFAGRSRRPRFVAWWSIPGAPPSGSGSTPRPGWNHGAGGRTAAESARENHVIYGFYGVSVFAEVGGLTWEDIASTKLRRATWLVLFTARGAAGQRAGALGHRTGAALRHRARRSRRARRPYPWL